MEFIEVQATFVIPDGTENTFVPILGNAINVLLLPMLSEEQFWYYGIWQNEWFGDYPDEDDDWTFRSETAEKFSREKNTSPSLDNDLLKVCEKLIAWDNSDGDVKLLSEACSLARQAKKFSREKITPVSDITRKTRLALSKRTKAVKKIPLDLPPSDGGGFVQKVNVGVAKHVITRKHYPDPRCKTLCTMMNTDYCRLKCDQDRLEPLD